MILALLISRLDVGFIFFKWVALVFCPRRPRGLVRASSGALVWKHVICGCCRVTSQKRLNYRLQALSSLFFAVMPSILRIRLDGWFSRCRGQSSASRLVESDCPYGAELRPCPGLLGWTKSSVISHALLGSINLPIFIHV